MSAALIRRAMAHPIMAGADIYWEPGWEGRGRRDPGGRPYAFRPRGFVAHHTATSARTAGDYPSLGLVRSGRPDLPGPLSQFGLGRSGRIYVIAAGYANHAGGGGWRGLSGNGSVWGCEAENDGVGQPWSPGQLHWYPRLAAASAAVTPFGAEMVCAHREWTPTKIDPTGIDMGWFRGEVARLLAGSPQEDSEMFKPSGRTQFHIAVAANSRLWDLPEAGKNADPVGTYLSDGGPDQRWETVGHADGTISLVTRGAKGEPLALDVPRGEAVPDARLQVWDAVWNANQRFRRDGDRVLHVGSGLAVDLAITGRNAGWLILWEPHEGLNQVHRFIPTV